MTDDNEPTQLTQPTGRDEHGEPYKPVKIPVPNRGQVMDFFRKVMQPGNGESAPQPPGLRP